MRLHPLAIVGLSLGLVGCPGDKDTDKDDTDTFRDPDSDTDTETDTDTGETAATGDTGPSIPGIGELSPGDLVITEMMMEPDDCPDEQAEFIEFRNVSNRTFDLGGLVVRDPNSGWSIPAGTIVEPGQWVLGIRRTTASRCYGLSPDFAYGIGLNLRRQNGSLELSARGVTIDEVSWSQLPGTTGASLQLSIDRINAVDNDDMANWCYSTGLVPGGTVDLGSPGDENIDCMIIEDTGDETGETGDTDDSGITDSNPDSFGPGDTGEPDSAVESGGFETGDESGGFGTGIDSGIETGGIDSGIDTGLDSGIDSGINGGTGIDSGITGGTGIDSGITGGTGIDSGITGGTGVDTGITGGTGIDTGITGGTGTPIDTGVGGATGLVDTGLTSETGTTVDTVGGTGLFDTAAGPPDSLAVETAVDSGVVLLP